MHPHNRCDKHLSPPEVMTGNKELGKEMRAVVAAFILSGVFRQCLDWRKKIQEEADVIQGGGRGGGCDYYSVPTVKKNDVHVIVSCLLQ